MNRELFMLTVSFQSQNFFFNVMYPFRVTFSTFMNSIQLLIIILFGILFYFQFIAFSFFFCFYYIWPFKLFCLCFWTMFQNGFEFVPPDFDIWVSLLSTDFVLDQLFVYNSFGLLCSYSIFFLFLQSFLKLLLFCISSSLLF